MVVITIPVPWLVTLRDGSVAVVWASSYSIEDGSYVFDTLVNASPDEQRLLEVSARTPSDPNRVGVVNARLPEGTVESVESAPWPM